MADELTINVSTQYEDAQGVSLGPGGISATDFKVDVTTKTPFEKRATATTGESALNLAGNAAAGAHLTFKNLDATNYIEIRMASGAANDHVKVLPGECACFRFGSDVTAPYVIANTASCDYAYRLVPA